MNRSFFLNILIALFVMLILYAITAKLLHFSEYVRVMHKQPLATWFTNFLIYAIPASELIVVGLLITERSKLLGLYLFTGMMIVFTIYVSQVLNTHQGLIPCTCAGLMKTLSWTTYLYFNISFVVVSTFAIFMAHKMQRDLRPYSSSIA